MLYRNGNKAARERQLAVIAGAMIATLAIGLASSRTPVLANDVAPRSTLDEAFAPFDMTGPDAAPALPDSPDERGDLREIGGGMASYYGAGFAGRPTASGEPFDPSGLSAAHRTLPFGTRIKVTNPHNGRSVVVRINDRGPFHHGRVIDLSQEAARQIGLIWQGSGVVRLATLGS
ncbi:MAG: septal ring lytic transglycosylase RlpA family protein [Alphaproteobacteria bacterium]|nr:septal ring lytic transglycosylase RlpA family protein [Alphaproteobacteria bacterium]